MLPPTKHKHPFMKKQFASSYRWLSHKALQRKDATAHFLLFWHLLSSASIIWFTHLLSAQELILFLRFFIDATFPRLT